MDSGLPSVTRAAPRRASSSAMPQVSVQTTGVPAASASMTVMPNGSFTLASTWTAAVRYASRALPGSSAPP